MEERFMNLEIRELRKKDYRKAIAFAITGMHFNWYMDSEILLKLYGRYFWYLELNRATQVIAAYAEDELAGVLLADMKGEDKKYRTFGTSFYVKVFDILQHLFAKDGVSVYDEANRELFLQYRSSKIPDGEIIFLAADPESTARGTGSLLLREFERREKGKEVFLYTDNACTYQFYEHRGFVRAGERNIILEIGSKKVELQCLLYSKLTD